MALVILGCTLQSYRHIRIALHNFICTLLLSFAILVPISDAIPINPFTPTIMLSLDIAICFDYVLFMLNRFKEELVDRERSTADAVLAALDASGHVVVLSGATLFVSFVLLLAFPQNFLSSVGWACCHRSDCGQHDSHSLLPAGLSLLLGV